MTELDYKVISAMRTYGGSFVNALATCAAHADASNLAKIKTTWHNYWQEYTRMALEEHPIEFSGNDLVKSVQSMADGLKKN
jgi:pyruvate/2-oxoacid:ferredoxin oxidoreductase beta subunit